MKLFPGRKRPDDLPKIQNAFLYLYACLAKLLAALLFCPCFLLAVLALACCRLLARVWKPLRGFSRSLSRRCLAFACRAYLFLLRGICFMRLKLADEERTKLRNLRSSIVVANHPSLLDLPLLLSCVPSSCCIIGRPGQVQRTMQRTMQRAVQRTSLCRPLAFLLEEACIHAPSWGGLVGECGEFLSGGGNIIIFPEQRLTPRSGTNSYRRTAARIARECGCGIQPLYIGGSDKYGIGSPAAPLAASRAGAYRYELKLLPPIASDEYAELSDREASVAVTKKIHDEISAEAYLSDYRIV